MGAVVHHCVWWARHVTREPGFPLASSRSLSLSFYLSHGFLVTATSVCHVDESLAWFSLSRLYIIQSVLKTCGIR